MPRIPPIGAASTIAATLFLAPLSTNAQTTWRGLVGYDSLVAELGGTPPGQYSGASFVPAADSGWHYRKGTSEASSPTDDWRNVGFVEDITWLTGQTPIGYGDGDDNTTLTDMEGFGGYSSVYLRHTFTVATGAIPTRLLLRVYVDDGAVIWINGVEAARLHVGPGFLAFNATATSHEAEWEGFILADASQYLVEGPNVIAVHALNQAVSSSDFSIDVELLSPALRVSHVEGTSNSNYLPESWPGGSDPNLGDSYPGTGGAINQTFFVRSIDPELGYSSSSHARNVGVNYIYGGGTRTLAGNLEEVDGYSAGGWLNNDYILSDDMLPPLIEVNPIQNHSWVTEPGEEVTAAELNDVLRRLDFAIARDSFLCVAGINNLSTTTMPPLLGTAYNAISVGRTDGDHSRGGTLSDYDGTGRIKPEIVAPGTATSWATGMVSSAAALLLAAANDNIAPEAFRSEVIKAILMAGAIKDGFPGWTRTTTQPIDTIYGSGELNIHNSYRILDGGKSVPTVNATGYGWDNGSLAASSSAVYTLVIPNSVGECSAILTWNRKIDTATWLGDTSFSDTVADMSLRLERLGSGGPTLCDSSDSSIDNVEHVYLRGLTAGTYLLTVETDVAVDYGLAWRADPALLPSFSMMEGTTAGDIDFAFSDVATGKTYTLESSTDLISWTSEHSFVGSATPADHTVVGGLLTLRKFFRLTWDPVN